MKLGEEKAKPRRSSLRLHGFTWLACVLSFLSLVYLNLAGEGRSDLDEPLIRGTLFGPVYVHGWPARFMIREPNMETGLSQRWAIGTPQGINYFSVCWLVLDVTVIGLCTLATAVCVERWRRKSSLRFRIIHLLALVAWLASGITYLLQIERRRFVTYDSNQDESQYPEFLKRFLFDVDSSVDFLPATIAFISLGFFWIESIRLVGWVSTHWNKKIHHNGWQLRFSGSPLAFGIILIVLFFGSWGATKIWGIPKLPRNLKSNRFVVDAHSPFPLLVCETEIQAWYSSKDLEYRSPSFSKAYHYYLWMFGAKIELGRID